MITATRDPRTLRGIAEAAGRELESATAQEILVWAADEFGAGLAVTASMQDLLLVQLAAQARPGIDVLFLDTGYHFVETIGTADASEVVYDITLRRLRPELTVSEQDARHGADLFARDPDTCCALRKVAPLNAALAGYEAWATGLRRAESPTRANTPVVAFDERKGKVKIAPLARWTDEQVVRYLAEHGVLLNPLLSDEYPSIGCAPCTRKVLPGEDSRAGRWAGLAKTECGIHT